MFNLKMYMYDFQKQKHTKLVINEYTSPSSAGGRLSKYSTMSNKHTTMSYKHSTMSSKHTNQTIKKKSKHTNTENIAKSKPN